MSDSLHGEMDCHGSRSHRLRSLHRFRKIPNEPNWEDRMNKMHRMQEGKFRNEPTAWVSPAVHKRNPWNPRLNKLRNEPTLMNDRFKIQI
jgi:hypothetical protein